MDKNDISIQLLALIYKLERYASFPTNTLLQRISDSLDKVLYDARQNTVLFNSLLDVREQFEHIQDNYISNFYPIRVSIQHILRNLDGAKPILRFN